MTPLGKYQRQMCRALLTLDPSSTEAMKVAGLALRIHCATIQGSLVRALRLTYSTLLSLMGEERFVESAIAFAQRNPPKDSVLYEYGVDFPDSLRRFESEKAPQFLRDVARFDLLIDWATRQRFDVFGDPLVIDPYTSFRLARSLRCERFRYAVDCVRDGAMRDELGNAANIQPSRMQQSAAEILPLTRRLAIWRTPAGATVRALTESAAIFLETLIAGRGLAAAIEATGLGRNAGEVIETVRDEVFSASFCLITRSPEAA